MKKENGTDFEMIGSSVGRMVARKQMAYGDSFGKSSEVLKILFPSGVRVEQYVDFLAVTRVIDKLFRIATSRDAFGEDPWEDILGYALLAVSRIKRLDHEPSTQPTVQDGPI